MTDVRSNREWFKFLAMEAPELGLHPEDRTTAGREVLTAAVDTFAGIDRKPALAAFDALVTVVDRWLCEHDPVEKLALEGDVEDALLVLVPTPVKRTAASVVAA